MILLSVLIIAAYSVNALMDGIAFTKSPAGRDLNLLWHTAKYVWVGLILLTGIQFCDLLSIFDFLPLVLWTVSSAMIGVVIWRITYRIFRRVDWPDWA